MSQDPSSFRLVSACGLLPISWEAMCRVSSLERVRGTPAGASLPLISTSGGLPGVKNRSLILGELFNIAARSAGVEKGAGAGAVAAEAGPVALGAVAAGTTLGGTLDGEDIA